MQKQACNGVQPQLSQLRARDGQGRGKRRNMRRFFAAGQLQRERPQVFETRQQLARLSGGASISIARSGAATHLTGPQMYDTVSMVGGRSARTRLVANETPKVLKMVPVSRNETRRSGKRNCSAKHFQFRSSNNTNSVDAHRKNVSRPISASW